MSVRKIIPIGEARRAREASAAVDALLAAVDANAVGGYELCTLDDALPGDALVGTMDEAATEIALLVGPAMESTSAGVLLSRAQAVALARALLDVAGVEKAEEVPDAVAPESASARVRGSGGAKTPRERAVEVLAHGLVTHSSEIVFGDARDEDIASEWVGSIEEAGLRIVTAEDAERLAQIDRQDASIKRSLDKFDCALLSAPAAPSVPVPLDAAMRMSADGSTDPCPECHATEGAHKLDCSRGRRGYTGPAKGRKCPECNGEGRVFSIDASSYDDRDCSRCRGTGKG